MADAIVSTRVLNHSQERVFAAFSDSAQLAEWWGPAGFTNRFREFDLRPGGTWDLVMHGPDGTEHRMVKRFVEIVPPERIELQHLDPVHGFRMIMRFTPESEGTRVTWMMDFDSAGEAERVRLQVEAANEENLDRLDALLEATGDEGTGSPPGREPR